MTQQKVTLQSLVWVVMSMTVYGLHPIFAHYMVQDISPIFLAGVSLFIASIPLLVQLTISKKLQIFYRGIFLRPLIFVVLFSGIGDLLFFVGTKLTSGANTALLLQIEPMYALVLAGLFLGEAIKAKQIFALMTVVLGAVVVVYKGTAPLNIGDVLIIFSPLFYQLSHLNSKKVMHKVKDTNIIPATRLLYGGTILTILAIILNPTVVHELSSPVTFFSVILFGLYASLDYFLWYQVLKRLPLSFAASFLPLSVFVSFFGAMIFLKESISLTQYLGLTFIVSGLLWLSLLHLREKPALQAKTASLDNDKPL